MGDNVELDQKDRGIINLLLKDARLSYRQIAKKLKMSAATIMNRIKRLENEGVIRGYSAIVDYEKAGYDISVIVDMRISKGHLLDVEKKIASHPNVFALYDNTGDFDATVIAKFKNRRKMDAFLKKIQKYDFVERTKTAFVLNIIKEEYIGVE